MSKANKADEAANEYLRSLDFGYEADTFADFKEGFKTSDKLHQIEIERLTEENTMLKKALIRSDDYVTKIAWDYEEKPLRVKLEEKISELTKEVSEITKHKDYAEKVSYQTSTDNAKLIGKVTELKEEVERLNKERDSSLKEKMYFNRMKELVSKVAYDSEHYTQKTYEVLRNDAITLLDEYKNNH
jgi:hypothetical protein